MAACFANTSPSRLTGFSTLVDLLHFRSQNQPSQIAYTFLQDGETETVSVTYRELEQRAKAIAVLLQSSGLTGERALLIYPPGLEFIAGFFGCLYAGVVAVPVYPPRHHWDLSRLEAIAVNARVAIALTNLSLLTKIQDLFVGNLELASLRCLATDNSDINLTSSWQELATRSNTLAFLQYTSGSTGIPKGVAISHRNLLHNLATIQQGFELTPDSRGVSWLPLYHDMGLIGGLLQPLYIGAWMILISPVIFLQKPFRWLQAITKYKATTSGGPNFAYDLCIRRITPEQRSHLDLSSWEIAFNGAEPVRAETMARFAATFAPCGFRREAFYPCYGMAEATLFVAGGQKATEPVICQAEGAAFSQNQIVAAVGEQLDTRTIVGCGQIPSGAKIAIVDPKALTVCPRDRVGEIWLSSPSVGQGYWDRLEETVQTFQAYLADSGEGPFLRTGDLGFLQDGELFVTGRLKDAIIIRGRNHCPQDIELTVEESHPALAPCGAAFAVEVDGEERLVVAYEVKRSCLHQLNVDEAIGDICQALAAQHGLQLYAVVLVKPGSIPKTSSNKIQRYACRAAFLAGSLKVVGQKIQSSLQTNRSI